MKRMRKIAPLAAVAALAGGTGAAVTALTHDDTPSANASVGTAQTAAATRSSIAAIYQRVSAGVVEITVTASSSGGGFGQFGQEQQTESEGSGFVLDKAGHIVTNAHVVDGATAITVHFASGRAAKATVVATDPSTDVALLEVDVAASNLHPLTLGDSASADVGESVIAIGSPFGLENTVTAGIVSAVDRQIEAPNGYTITGAIQTDAAINPGNSGGPLLDTTGRVIGINAQIKSSSDGNEGVGFAIPIDTVKKVVAQLLDKGTVTHAYLGVKVADAADGSGARIASVQSGSPAADAGVETGDVVTAVDGKSVGSAADLTQAIGNASPGDRIELRVRRDGSVRTITVELGTRPS